MGGGRGWLLPSGSEVVRDECVVTVFTDGGGGDVVCKAVGCLKVERGV